VRLQQLVLARAALLLAALLGVLHAVEHLQERRGVGARGRVAGVVGLNDGHLDVAGTARAALLLLAGRLLALQLALGARAVGGLHALVVAVELLAHR